MQRRTFISALGATAVSPLLRAAPPLAAPEPLDPKRGLRKKDGWTLAVIPDTQNYAKYKKNQPHFHTMTQWLADHAEAWNIQAVLHEGDLVEQNDIASGGGRGYGDQNATSQWTSARSAMARLDGVVPTIYTTGNHDYGTRNAEDRRTQFNSYFGLTDNPLTCDGHGGGSWIESAPNSFGARTLENAAYAFTAPDGRKMLIVALEWGPRREVVAWAKGLLARPAFTDHTALLLVHAYMYDDNQRMGTRERPGNPHHYPTGKTGNTHDGEDLWKALVQPSSNIQLVCSGHVMGKHVGYRVDQAAGKQHVHQMLFNAQGLGGGSRENRNGGDGWLRLLTFEPDGRTLSVRTFSPLYLAAGKSPWRTEAAWNFSVNMSSL